ncbi:glycosyltransferase [Streptomyces sp. NBC_00028]|uniref:glycosyltransferase n=1 Tax=Streptomyces sp. NBC_00028 TaxID=2975624 RepID=UPI00325358ED
MTTTILHVAQSSGGGVARVVTDVAAGQLARGHRVVVVCLPDSALSAAARRRGVEVLAWRAARTPDTRLPREVADLRRVIESVRPDVVHLHSSKAGLAGRLALRGRLPTVFQPHAWSFNAVTGGLRVASVRWERAGARWAHQVVCVSEGERAQGLAASVEACFTVIPNGIDLDRFPVAGAPRRDAARRRLGLAPSVLLTVCVGRLCRQKGQDILLGAWRGVVDRLPAAQLVLVGDGPDREPLMNRAPADVVFAGAVDDPRDWYRAADVVVLPSRWEGMALAPLEAMACGRPVVLTDVPGARESLPPDVTARTLVPRGDGPALADAVTALLADREACDAIGRQGYVHVRRHHDVRRVVERTEAVYDAALRARAAGTGSFPARRPGLRPGRTSGRVRTEEAATASKWPPAR